MGKYTSDHLNHAGTFLSFLGLDHVLVHFKLKSFTSLNGLICHTICFPQFYWMVSEMQHTVSIWIYSDQTPSLDPKCFAAPSPRIPLSTVTVATVGR